MTILSLISVLTLLAHFFFLPRMSHLAMTSSLLVWPSLAVAGRKLPWTIPVNVVLFLLDTLLGVGC